MKSAIMPGESPEIYTVSQLNAAVRRLVEGNFGRICLVGEISNLVRPSSGHFYFSLKDPSAQVRCAFFRHAQRTLSFQPEAGQQVLVEVQASLYEVRGDYQLIVHKMRLAGEGKLQIAFDQLKVKLAAEGLFKTERKTAIPTMPKCIGVITSPTGAVIHDIIRVLHRRFRSLPIIIYPSSVQGQTAGAELVQALEQANYRNECDVLILARGGGSLEDLWPFNEEAVARAIFASKIPIVTGIGHEVDTTIADFVADQRCATPSAAAEWLSPNIENYWNTLTNNQNTLLRLIQQKLQQEKLKLKHLTQRLQHPQQRLQQHSQHLDQLEHRLRQVIQHCLILSREKLQTIARSLDAVSPLNTLQRGYAIISQNQRIVTTITQTKTGDAVTTRLKDGTLECTVNRVVPPEAPA